MHVSRIDVRTQERKCPSYETKRPLYSFLEKGCYSQCHFDINGETTCRRQSGLYSLPEAIGSYVKFENHSILHGSLLHRTLRTLCDADCHRAWYLRPVHINSDKAVEI